MSDTMPTFREFVAESDAAAEEPEKFERTYEVPSYNLPNLQKKIDKLNRVAVKLKTAPIVLTPGEPFQKKVGKDEHDNPLFVEFVPLKVTGEAPKLSGWSFVGKLEPIALGSKEILAKTAPGAKQLPARFQHVDHIECEHCKTQRFRTDSFIVKKGRTYKQVGRQCLRDFLGHVDPNQYASFAESLSNLDALFGEGEENERDYSGHRRIGIITKDAVTKSIAAIRQAGFKSKQYDNPTSNDVYRHFFPPVGNKETVEASKIPSTPEDEKMAEDLIANSKTWANSKNEFELNLSKLLKAEMIEPRYLGYIAAAANNHLKALGAIAAKKSIKDGAKDEHFGEIGAKHKIKAELISINVYQGNSYSYYHDGLRAIAMFKTEDGHIIKMFTSHTEMEKGDIVIISGKIGRHEVETYEKSPFKGMKLTIMAPGARITEFDPNEPVKPEKKPRAKKATYNQWSDNPLGMPEEPVKQEPTPVVEPPKADDDEVLLIHGHSPAMLNMKSIRLEKGTDTHTMHIVYNDGRTATVKYPAKNVFLRSDLPPSMAKKVKK